MKATLTITHAGMNTTLESFITKVLTEPSYKKRAIALEGLQLTPLQVFQQAGII
ncbi:hypothetical protein PL11201_10057 [Planktothrix sp. PCC 11201]|uniref:hypothetical protein n=1 Tax=Planktothrix sp. PCC 11201 TaxID=1729650 RepID=UPI00091D7397|nr:hypothetical protein [Planktothrix sp. PCC 11201]SKB11132.1 hypothetical protein PL11201_10057 [Planktothrix sp. PCC 11201]